MGPRGVGSTVHGKCINSFWLSYLVVREAAAGSWDPDFLAKKQEIKTPIFPCRRLSRCLQKNGEISTLQLTLTTKITVVDRQIVTFGYQSPFSFYYILISIIYALPLVV
jgi:hypothetical protein